MPPRDILLGITSISYCTPSIPSLPILVRQSSNVNVYIAALGRLSYIMAIMMAEIVPESGSNKKNASPSRRSEGIRSQRRAGDSPYDPLDRRIVSLLEKDGRMSNTDVAETLGVTEATIRKRVTRLLDEGLIRILAVPDPVALGMTTSAIIGISVTLDSLESVADALIALPETRYVGYSTGPYDLIIEAFFSSNEGLLRFLSHRIARISGITRTETSVILRVGKFSYEWEIPEEILLNEPDE